MNTVKHVFESSIITRQNEAETQMLREFEHGNFTLHNPLIKINPYLIAPLSAVVLFETEEEVAVNITIFGKTPNGDMKHTFPKAKKHVLPILGLYENYQNKVEIELYRGEKTVISIPIAPLTNKIKLDSIHTTKEYMGDQCIFLTPAETSYICAFDAQGDIRFNLNIPCIWDLKRLKNGHILIGCERLVKMPYYTAGLYEMDMTGKIYNDICLPGGYHHDCVEMEDGNLLALTSDLRSLTVEDKVSLIHRETGEVIKTWDIASFLPVGTAKSGSWTEEDWFHCNALWYDKHTNSITLSGRHMDAMVNIDFETSALNWIIGDPTGWPEEYQKYFFTPVGNRDFEWQYEQHANLITPSGDVMCFDNGHYRSKIKDNYLKNKDNHSRGVRYKINTDNMTIEQVWQYGRERGTEFFSFYICNVEYYGENHYMVHSGGIQEYDGVASEDFVVYFQDDPKAVAKSTTVELLNDHVMLELKVFGNFYRAEKLTLYTESNLQMGDCKLIGSLGETLASETLIEMDSCGEMLPESCNAVLVEEDDRFTLKSRFESGQLVMLMLEGTHDTKGYFISTAKNEFAALCCGTFIEADPRNTSTSINKAGLNDIYDVKVIIDDKKYETGIQIK